MKGAKRTMERNTVGTNNRRKEVFTFTGRLSVRRSGMFRMALQSGHDVSKDVTKRSTVVVAGALRLSSRKLKEAGRLNIPVVTEDEFLEMTGYPAQLRLWRSDEVGRRNVLKA